VLLRQLVGGAFDVHIGGLGLAGVDDIQIMVLLDLPCAAAHLVGVEHQNRHAALVARIVAQNVHQAAAGGVQIAVGQPAQVVPGKNHVVAVHQQVIGPGGHRLGGDAGRSGGGVQGGAGCLFGVSGLATTAYLAVGALKNRQQLLVLFQRAPVGGGPAATIVGVSLPGSVLVGGGGAI